jgi:hypothetical protein
MGGRIPEQIKREVIRKWLLGEKRDKIAADLDIGDGTVSEIMKLYSQKDSEVDLIRQVALAIKDLQTDVVTFSQALRLKNILNDIGLNEDKIESLVKVAEVHCFRRGIGQREFFEIVEKVATYSDEVGMPVEDLPNHIAQQKSYLEGLYSEIKDVQNNLSVILRDNDVTLRDLEDYKENKPIIDTLVEVQLERAQMAAEMDQLREQVVKERNEKITQKYEWMLPEHELKEANNQLINQSSRPIRYDELYRLANDFFRQPSKYVDVIETLRERKLNLKKEKS